MSSIINADTSDGLKITSDTSGQIDFQSAGSTKATIDTAGNLKFDSGYGSVATAYGCRAWVNFNGTSTVAIRDSANVSSITDNGTGNYTINFTTTMPDVNYATLSTGIPPVENLGTVCLKYNGTYSTSAVQITSGTSGVGFQDFTIIGVSILR
jgi:hypothetical protein